jgi:ectoine hydroxylase-related dioxygenase (phytanoyl-CoA dioxygenase family)
MLSEAQISQYRQDGYVVIPDMLRPAQISELQRVIDQWMANASSVDTHDDIYDLEPGHTRAAPRVRRIKAPHRLNPLFLDVVRSGPVLDVLAQLIGPNLRLHGSKLNIKAPQYGSPVEWHQDWAFYPHTNDDILAIGVMLDDMELSNGPLLFVPGTHRGPVFDHHYDGRFCGAIDPASVASLIERAVPVTGRAGAMSFHHVRLLHGSAENTSSRRRQLLLYEVCAADAWPLMGGMTSMGDFDGRMLAGENTVEPRLAAVPVRMPHPPPLREGSIYENQAVRSKRYFATAAQ